MIGPLNSIAASVLTLIGGYLRARGRYDQRTLACFEHAWKWDQDPRSLLRLALFTRDLGHAPEHAILERIRLSLAELTPSERESAVALIVEGAGAQAAPIPPELLAASSIPAVQPLLRLDPMSDTPRLGLIHERQCAWRQAFGLWLMNRRRICVVGNSPTLDACNAGAAINEHDVVIRFNHFFAGGANISDVGTRTDVWVVSPGYQGPVSLEAEWLIVSGPDMRFRLRDWRIGEAFLRAGKPVLTVPLDIWGELVAALEAPPSAGVLVLKWLAELRAGWKGIVSAGVGTDQGRSRHYHLADRRQKAAVRHDWKGERALLLEWQACGLTRLEDQDMVGGRIS